jgi:hypothetical protein
MNKNGRWLIGLAATTALMSGVALWQTMDKQAPALHARQGELVFPYAKEQASHVAMIVLTRGEHMTTLARQQGQWMVQTEDGMQPANLLKLRKLMMLLTQAQYKEPKTSREFQLPALALGDPAMDGKGQGTLIQFFHADGAVLAELVAGAEGKNFRGTSYMRLPHEQQSWLIDGVFPRDVVPDDWSDQMLFDIPKEAVQSVRIQHPDGQVLSFFKERRDAVGYTLATVLRPGQRVTREMMDAVASGLQRLKVFASVPRSEWQYAVGHVVEVAFKTFDGRLVTAYLAPQEGGRTLVAFEMEAAGEVDDPQWVLRSKQVQEWSYVIDDDRIAALAMHPDHSMDE